MRHDAWHERYSPPTPIERVTATQITAHGRRWKRKTGIEIGGNRWRPVCLVLFTPEVERRIQKLRAEAKAQDACRTASEILLNAVRNDAAEAIRLAALLPAELREAKP
jgi:hypothetical protein